MEGMKSKNRKGFWCLPLSERHTQGRGNSDQRSNACDHLGGQHYPAKNKEFGGREKRT